MTPPPPPIQRNITPPIPNLQPQVNTNYYKYRARSVQRSPNVTINSNIMAGYNTLNGYRMQQPSMINTGYLNPGFINQSQLPVQMMNVHPQSNYQDTGMQPPRPTNTMYATYSYINGSLPPPPQTLNGVMRR